MKIYNQTQDENIAKAAFIFMKHFKDQDFLNIVRGIQEFNHSEDSGRKVAITIDDFEGSIYLRQYKPFNPFTKAIAYAELPNIYFNSRKNFGFIERVETIAHESLHLMGYSHKGNYKTKYNEGTVPYLIANVFKNYVSEIY